ncbi:hypothetical protein D9758_011265 [Tetrapyrgos nigripes]|uniref:Uncharacterized protein n=1 Tax=Tetrapyrgos nigripes TaxID=182062 RepID=A0A8H5CSW3_9AGAR|nr:hypothetical protein D9758_011265 [Tetrapyrgos nigripes]
MGKYVAQVREYDSKREHKANIFAMVNLVEEALRAANDWKVDAIITQGIKSGGHGGSEAPSLLILLQAVLGTRFLFTHECIYSQDKTSSSKQAWSTRRDVLWPLTKWAGRWDGRINVMEGLW